MRGLPLFFLLSCTSAFAGVKNPNTLMILTGIDPGSLDPASAYGGTGLFVNYNVYETLIANDGGDLTKFVPLLATKVPTPDAKGLVYRFPIRKGVSFHDGSVLTPEDARYSLMRFMLADRAASPSFLLLEAVTGLLSTRDASGRLREDVYMRVNRAVRVQGRDLVVTLERPFGPFLAVIARWGLIVDKEWAVARGGWDGSEKDLTRFNNSRSEDFPFHKGSNGTGPYRLNRWDLKASEIVLSRFDGYWSKNALLPNVRIKKIEDFNLKKMMLLNGDADSIFVDHHQLSLVRGQKGLRITEKLPILNVGALNFNFAINPADKRFIGSAKLDGDGIPPDFFRSKEVRSAFAHLIDYEGLIRDLYRGSAERATGFIPRGMIGFSQTPAPYRFDPKKAERLLRGAFGGRLWKRGFSMILVYATSAPANQVIANQIASAFRTVNPRFRIEVRGLSWSAIVEHRKKRILPILFGGWRADYADPHNMAGPLLHSEGYFGNALGFGDLETDRLIDKARMESDQKKRLRTYDEIRRRWADTLPVIFTFVEQWVRVEREWVHGYIHNPIYPGAPSYSPLAPLFKKE